MKWFTSNNERLYDGVFIFITIIFITIAYLLSVVAHNNFFTNALDMGIYNQYVYKFSHFKYPSCTIYPHQSHAIFFLGDHTTLLLPFESLLYWILGKNVLLYLQIIYFVIGAWGLYKLINVVTKQKSLALFASILFYLHYSIYTALSFDYHTNIIGIMLIPWIIYFYYTSNLLLFYILSIIGILSKEDISIYYFLIAVFLFVINYKNQKPIQYKFIISLSSISLVYFLISYLYILPKFNPNPNLAISNWKFIPEAGLSIKEMVLNIIKNPAKMINLMSNAVEKQQKINDFIYTGGILIPFIGWIYLLPVIPLFLHTLLSSEWGMWGNLGHYNVLLAVWLPFIISIFIYKIQYKVIQMLLYVFCIYQYTSILLNTPLEAIHWTRIQKIFYTDYYYQRFNIQQINEMIKIIPDNAIVSASNHLVPHLAFRDKIYYFPKVIDAEYIAIIENDCNDRYYYFNNSIDCYTEIKKYRENPDWEIVYDKNNVLLLHKKPSLP